LRLVNSVIRPVLPRTLERLLPANRIYQAPIFVPFTKLSGRIIAFMNLQLGEINAASD
jgi:hypothetical protein